jgi:hypothetical protein
MQEWSQRRLRLRQIVQQSLSGRGSINATVNSFGFSIVNCYVGAKRLMTLLHEIQLAAIDGNVGISTVLRKAKILAARLHNAAFED